MLFKMAASRSSALASKSRVLRILRPPVSLMPFLYPPLAKLPPVTTRAAHTSSKPNPPSKSRKHVSDSHSADIPFDQESFKNIRNYDSHVPQSTMTDLEKEAFSRLFDTLTSTPQNPINKSPNDEIIKSHQRKRSAEPSNMATLEREIRGSSLDDHTPSSMPGADYDIAHIYGEQLVPEAIANVGRYPAAIRKHAERAIVLQAMERHRKDSQDPVTLKAHAEMRRVEALLLACETDKQLRDVMQTEVFNEARLVLKAAAPATKKRLKLKPIDYAEKYLSPDEMKLPKHEQGLIIRKRMRQAGEKLQLAPKEPSLPESENTERLQLLTHTYAPLLLLAVRLLLKHNPQSNMAPALLEAARSIGPVSYTLAASTPLYNALLRQAWQTSMQYSRVLPLLKEMHDSGLNVDHNTLDVVADISQYRQCARWGWFGVGVKAVEDGRVRSSEADQIDAWQDKILKAIQETEIERVNRAEERSKSHSEEAADAAAHDADTIIPATATATAAA